MAMLTLHCGRMSFHDEAIGHIEATFNQVSETRVSLRVGGFRLWSGLERDGLRQATLPKSHRMECQPKRTPYRISRRPGHQGLRLRLYTRVV